MKRFLAIAMFIAISGCAYKPEEIAAINAIRQNALDEVPLTPGLRIGIADAVKRAWDKNNIFGYHFKLIAATISDKQLDYPNILFPDMKPKAYYCVYMELEQIIMNKRKMFAVYPKNTSDGKYEIEVKWHFNDAVPSECSRNMKSDTFPELVQLMQ